MKRFLIIVVIIIVLIIVLSLLVPMRFGDIDDSIPGGMVEGKVTGLKLHVKAKFFSSTVDKDTTIKECDIMLTPMERINLTFALLNPRFDQSALDGYTYDLEEVIAEKTSVGDGYWKELYEECDLNNDGIITRREFTNWYVLTETPWGIVRDLFIRG